MQTATRPIASLWTSVRAQFRKSREERAGRVRLERELACYTSTADLDDMDAILDRYSDEETRQMRRILASQRSR